MKKSYLIILIIVDLVVMAGAATLIVGHYHSQPLSDQPLNSSAPSRPASSVPAPAGAKPTPRQKTPPALALPAAPARASKQIGFTYHNRKAKQVQILGDFTGWRKEPMQNNGGTWTYKAVLDAGEYSYVFSVDNKFVRDPANKRTKKIGSNPVSVLTVPAVPSRSTP